MRKSFSLFILILILITVTACGERDGANDDSDELKMLEVEFEIPETLDIGETLPLEAVVTYGDEKVTDADEVVFEVWERDDQDNGEMIDSENNGDGTYTAEVSFDHDGIFEMYAHTTAREMHTMPKREVIVGEGGDYEDLDESNGFHTEGFDMHFMNPEDIEANEEVELMVHLLMDDEEFKDATVRYEIWSEATEDDRNWEDAEESAAGEYTASYTFKDQGTYTIQIHVEDDNDLHENAEYEVEVTE